MHVPALETNTGHMLRLGSGYAYGVEESDGRVRIRSATAAGCESAIECDA